MWAQGLFVLTHSILQSHIEGVGYEGMTNGDLLKGVNKAHEIRQVVQIEVVTGIHAQSNFVGQPCRRGIGLGRK